MNADGTVTWQLPAEHMTVEPGPFLPAEPPGTEAVALVAGSRTFVLYGSREELEAVLEGALAMLADG